MTPQECQQTCAALALAFSGANSQDPEYRKKIQTVLSVTLRNLLADNNPAFERMITALEVSHARTAAHLRALQQGIDEPGIREMVTNFQQYFIEDAGRNDALRTNYAALVAVARQGERGK
jgi:hypothetical protein